MGSDRQIVFSTEWFSIEQECFNDLESLKGKPYFRLKLPDGVMVLALTESDKIVLVRQFRPSIGAHSLELPSGSIDDSESPEQAAARELYEETGFRCGSLIPLGTGRTIVSRTDSRIFAFLGLGAVRDSEYVGEAGIEVVVVDPARFKALVMSGELEPFSALAMLVLADWKLGRELVSQGRFRDTPIREQTDGD